MNNYQKGSRTMSEPTATDIYTELGRNHRTGADHYRTADMHRACALSILAQAQRRPADDSAETPDPWLAADKFAQHMALGDLHVRLAEARIGAVRLLMQQQADRRDNVTQRQRVAIENELKAWADTIAPL
jgi:hypothetical protein